MAIESKNKKEKKKKYKSWAFILYISDEQQEHTYLFDSMREHKKKKLYMRTLHMFILKISLPLSAYLSVAPIHFRRLLRLWLYYF